jgi:hypothetical protein
MNGANSRTIERDILWREPVAPVARAARPDDPPQRGGDIGSHALGWQREKARHRLEASLDQVLVFVDEAIGETPLERDDVVEAPGDAHVRVRSASVEGLKQRDDLHERHRTRILLLRAQQGHVLFELRAVAVQRGAAVDPIERLADEEVARVPQQEDDPFELPVERGVHRKLRMEQHLGRGRSARAPARRRAAKMTSVSAGIADRMA